MNRLLIALSLCYLTVFSLSAQEEKTMKFGKINVNDLKMTMYDKDSSAEAIVLADKGSSSLEYNQSDGNFYLKFKRHMRIKILKKEAYDRADITIPLYHDASNRERINMFKAATYNLSGKKVQTTKVSRKSVFKEKVDKNHTNEKFTFPNVKEGSIIELMYSMSSDFIFNLQDWRFQSDIPTVWSEYIVEVPEYFSYERFAQGYHGMSINKTTNKRGMINYLDGDRTEFTKKVSHFLAENVPAFRTEPYMNSVKNFISEVNFELSSVQFPGAPVKRYMGSWADVNNTFLKSESFGKILKSGGFLKDEVAGIIAGKETDEEKVSAILSNVKSRMTWNRNYARYATDNLRQRLKAGEGNVADINLLLTNMLRKAGFQADPVLISTRRHGLVRESFALSSQFNYVVSAVILSNGTTMLLDATDKTLPGNLLPQRCLNGRGWRVSERVPGWVNLTSGGKETTLASVQLELSEDGTLSGKTDMMYSEYEARRIRGTYFDEKDKFEEKYSEQNGWEIKDMSIEGMKKLNESVKISCDIEVEEGIENLGNLIYLTPLITERVDENPFKLESREYPVDFISPQLSRYIATIKIPEGFKIEELPKSEVVTLPENSGKFSYYVQAGDGMISIRSTISINKRLFNSLEYPYLKQFYAKIVEKQAEQIVLKKATE